MNEHHLLSERLAAAINAFKRSKYDDLSVEVGLLEEWREEVSSLERSLAEAREALKAADTLRAAIRDAGCFYSESAEWTPEELRLMEAMDAFDSARLSQAGEGREGK